MKQKQVTFFSMFAGIAGMELGIQRAYEATRNNADGSAIRGKQTDPPTKHEGRPGLESAPGKNNGSAKRSPGASTPNIADQRPLCVGFSEIDPWAISIYQKHYPKHKNYGDATRIVPETIPDFELLVGGFPCQAFSIAGRRLGFEEARGTLFFEIARVLKVKRPKHFLLENVKGLLSHDQGRTFKTILATLTELGYCVEWEVLNSKNFGVPQNRERVFIVGHLGGITRSPVFPLGEVGEKSPAGAEPGQEQTATALRAKQGGPDIDQTYVAPSLRASDSKGGDTQTIVLEDFYPGRIRASKKAPTLRSGRAGLKIFRAGQIRRLTPTEGERLQGFPDNWTAGLSDTQRYKTIGNAVTVNVIQEIIKKLLFS